MSHISKIELKIQSLDDLRQACYELGYEFVEGQKTYKWFGEFVGDYPLPEGIKKEDLGKCDHAIRVPDCKYEIGVVKMDDHYRLIWDFYQSGGLHKKIGEDGGLIKQTYGIVRVMKKARQKRYKVHRKKIDKGIRLTLTL